MAKASLPTVGKNKSGKGGSSALASIGKKFVNNQKQLGKSSLGSGSKPKKSKVSNSGRGRRGRGSYEVARPERSSNSTESLEKVVNKSTVSNPTQQSGGNQDFVKKAFDVYTNLANFIKKSVGDLIQKIKSILGVQREGTRKETASVNAVSSDKGRAPSIEETKETEIAKEKELEASQEQVSELGHIRNILEKMLKKMDGIGAAGSGRGMLGTISDVANIASLARGGRGGVAAKGFGGTLAQTKNIAAKGGLGKLAAARGASKPITALAKTSDKIVGAIGGAKQKIVETGGKIAGGAAKALGFGTKMGTQAATTAASSGASAVSSVAGSAAASTTANVASKGGGFFSKLLNPLGAAKQSITKLAPKLFKFLVKVPVVGTLLETFFAGKDIAEIKENPEMSPQEKRAAIGNRIAAGIGGIAGAVGGAALLSAIPGGTLIGGVLGDLAGRWAVDQLMQTFGGGETVYKMFRAIPGLGSLISVDEDNTPDKTQQAKDGIDAAKESTITEPMDEIPTLPSSGSSVPTVKAQPTSLASSVMSQSTASPTSIFAKLTPADPSGTNEAVRSETQKAINTKIESTVSRPSPGKTEINNNYNTTVAGGGGGRIPAETSAAMPSAPSDDTMRKMLAGNVGGVGS